MAENIISTVTSKSQAGIPKAIRARMGLKSSDYVRYVVKGDKVEIEKSPKKQAVAEKKVMTGSELLALTQRLFGAKNGVDLELPSRGGDRAPPDFSGSEFGYYADEH